MQTKENIIYKIGFFFEIAQTKEETLERRKIVFKVYGKPSNDQIYKSLEFLKLLKKMNGLKKPSEIIAESFHKLGKDMDTKYRKYIETQIGSISSP